LKNLILITLSLALLTSCGLQRQINELKNREAQAEIDSQNRDAALQAQIDGLNAGLDSLRSQLVSMDSAFESRNEALADQDEEIQAAVAAMQAQQTSMLISLATLQGYTNIVGVYNPCGVQVAADEVFLMLSNGKFLASFSDLASGYNTRLSYLYDGNNFVTTDGSSCKFSVSGSGTLIVNERN
jgi:hypothetical protein